MRDNLKPVDILREDNNIMNEKDKNRPCAYLSQKGSALIGVALVIMRLIIMGTAVGFMELNLMDNARQAADGYQKQTSEKESISIGFANYKMDKIKGNENVTLTVNGAITKKSDYGNGWTVVFSNGNTYEVDEDGNITGSTTGNGSGYDEYQSNQETVKPSSN